MKLKNPKQLLRNPDEEPTHKLLEDILDKPVFAIIKKINQILATTEIDLEWRYYKDGKAWLGKATYRNKTIVWISVWESFIKTSFYFTEKTRPGVLNLRINKKNKFSFTNIEPIGKLIPLVLDVKDEESLHDFSVILNYKKGIH